MVDTGRLHIPAIDLTRIDPSKIPQKMLNTRKWLNWTYGIKDGKLAKFPIAPYKTNTKAAVAVNEPDNLTTFEEAYKTALNLRVGLGFSFFRSTGITGIDADHSVKNGEHSDLVKELLTTFPSYAEYSPSGNGIHIITEGKMKFDGFKNEKMGLEAYSHNRFFTVTGHQIEGTPNEVVDCGDALKQFEAKYNPKTNETPTHDAAPRDKKDGDYTNKQGETLTALRNSERNLDDFLRGGLCGKSSLSQADMAASCSLVYFEFSEADIKDILRRFRGREKMDRDDYLERTVEKAFNVVTRTYTQDRKPKEEPKKPEATEEAPAEKPKDKNLTEKALNLFVKDTFKTPDDIEALYRFKEGVYVQGETYVKGAIESAFGTGANTGLCGEVVNHLKRRSYVPRETFNKFEGMIPLQNGLLNLETGVMTGFDTNRIFTFKIQAKYDPSKRCEKWIRFMEQILPDEEDRLSLQEYAGYSLYPRMPYHKICFLVGDGRNGKGVFIRTIASILGEDNVSNIRIDQLNGGHRFIATNLYGKLVNVSSEPSVRWPLSTELLKQLTGEDWVDGEVKNKQNPVKFKPFAKQFVQANKLPKVNDTSGGWWQRVLYIRFTQTFTEENGKQIPNLEDQWLNNEDDRSGILNWLIEGWVRLNTNHRFTQSKTQREAMIEFKRASDPIAAFLTEECEYGPELYTQRDKLYDAYKDYAKSLNATPEGNRVFFERLRDTPGINLEKKKRIAGKNERVVSGLQLRDVQDVDSLDDFNESEDGADGADGALQTSRLKPSLDNCEEVEGKEKSLERVRICAPSAPSAPLPDTNDANPDSLPPNEGNLSAPKMDGSTLPPNEGKVKEVAPEPVESAPMIKPAPVAGGVPELPRENHNCERCGKPAGSQYKGKWLCRPCVIKEAEMDRALGGAAA